MPSTTLENLYDVLCAVVETTTGRRCWSKVGIQAAPAGPYALAYLTGGAQPATQDVVQLLTLPAEGANGETMRELVRGAVMLDVQVEFFRDTTGDTAQDAASRFRSGLQLSNRDDLWQICGLAGPVRIMDISAAFRADTESRLQVRFSLWANIASPLPLDPDIYDIASQEVDIWRNKEAADPPPDLVVNVSRYAGAGVTTEGADAVLTQDQAALTAEKDFHHTGGQ